MPAPRHLPLKNAATLADVPLKHDGKEPENLGVCQLPSGGRLTIRCESQELQKTLRAMYSTINAEFWCKAA